ncbi:MAG: hypothetical protein MHM6MM_003444 [Cercozoa sp. M6MM]
MWSRRLAATALGLTGAVTAFDWHAEHVLSRSWRTIWTGFHILYNYKVWYKRPGADPSEVNKDTAQRIVNALEKNGGIYIKFGQALSSFRRALPTEFKNELARLQDDVAHAEWSRIEKLITEEFGKHPDEVFLDFERTPVASASIAQVHRARRRDTGEVVAVKVQKPNIATQMPWDLWIYSIVAYALEEAFQLPLTWNVDFASRQFLLESDFLNEARNGELAREQFNEPSFRMHKEVHVPVVHHDLTTRRVLTCEWIDGIKLLDQEQIREAGYDEAKVMRTVVETFAHQIFETGHVHCDPHPGNILVRKVNGKPEIVLIDHGLYVSLSEPLRKANAQLWTAAFTGDVQTLRRVVESWGVGDSDAFVSALLMRDVRSNGQGQPVHLQKEISRRDMARRMHRNKQGEMSHDTVRNILADAQLMPNEVPFVMRNLAYVQALNINMGSPIDRARVLAYYAARGAHAESPWSRFIAEQRFRFMLWWLQLAFAWRRRTSKHPVMSEQEMMQKIADEVQVV